MDQAALKVALERYKEILLYLINNADHNKVYALYWFNRKILVLLVVAYAAEIGVGLGFIVSDLLEPNRGSGLTANQRRFLYFW